MRFSRRKLCFHLFPAKMQAVLIIDRDLFAVLSHAGFQGIQALFCTEAVIGISLLDQLFCIVQINTLGISLTLDIRAVSAIFVRSLVMDKSCFSQCAVNDLQRAVHKTFLVCILNTEHKASVLMLCDEISI